MMEQTCCVPVSDIYRGSFGNEMVEIQPSPEDKTTKHFRYFSSLIRCDCFTAEITLWRKTRLTEAEEAVQAGNTQAERMTCINYDRLSGPSDRIFYAGTETVFITDDSRRHDVTSGAPRLSDGETSSFSLSFHVNVFMETFMFSFYCNPLVWYQTYHIRHLQVDFSLVYF